MHHSSPIITAVFFGLLGLMVLALALEEKLHAQKSLITGVAAIVALIGGAVAGVLPFGEVILPNGHHVQMPVFIPAVDWGVITIILGAGLFIDVISKSGIFTWAAVKLTRMSSGDPAKLLFYYAALTVVFSALLNNVTAMIIVGSLTVVSLEKLGRREHLLGFLLIEGLLTNLGGLLTLISSVPNIILGNIAGIEFMQFVVIAAPYTVVASLLTVLLGMRVFGIRALATDSERLQAAQLVSEFDAFDSVSSMKGFAWSWVLLGAFILTIATTSWLPFIGPLGMGFVALAFAFVALIQYKSEVDSAYQKIDWDLIFFFINLFVVINVMEHAGVLDLIGGWIGIIIGMGDSLGAGLLIWSAALASAVTDNVPLAAVMGKILAAKQIPGDSHFWWAAIFGTNLGGNFTPIGSASTVVAVAIMQKNKLNVSFIRFVALASGFAFVQVVIATVYVLVFLQ